MKYSLAILYVVLLPLNSLSQRLVRFAPDSYLCDTSGWKLVWFDEFDGDSLNTKKWYRFLDNDNWIDGRVVDTPVSRGARAGSKVIYRDENVTVKDGSCYLTARYEPGAWMEANANFTSGMIMARNNEQKMPRYFVRGKFDMRARLPVATGVWTTFWLYGGGDNQIEGSEIDMLEYAPCKSSLRRMPWHLHGFHRGADYQDHRYIGNKYRLDDPGDWHVYTTEWDRHFIRFYVDGELKDVVSRFESGCIPDPDTEFPADRREVFPRVDEGMKLLATFDYTDDLYSRSLAGICLPIPRWLSDRNKVDARQPERHFIIDYIRVYQRADQLQRF